ncbi:MAG: AMP-binding protein [Pararhodobacter sp.]|nr:AMP-binding protein [Pararhodobacter sp.]
MTGNLKTTRPIMPVRTIEDIRAIEAQRYDDLVTARNLYDLLLATARHGGARQALTVLRSPDPADIGLSLTHHDLLGHVTRAANMFRAHGLQPGAGVAAFLTPTLPDLPALHLGAQVAGVASTINYLLSREAIIDLLNAEKATLLIIPAPTQDAACWAKAQGMMQAVPTLEKVLVIGGAGALPDNHLALEAALAPFGAKALDFTPTDDRQTVCALFHTGGTTGRPKLVPLTHGNQIHAAFGFGQVFGYCETDTVINGFPFFHVGGTMTVGLAVLAAGGHMVVPSPHALRPPEVIANYWRLVQHFRASVIGAVPTSLAALTTAWVPGTDVSSIRMAATGGAVLPAAVGERFQAATGIALLETYGMTEAAAAIAFNPAHGRAVAGSVGFRAPFSETRILRIGTDDALCAPGESGVVQVRGPQVFPGYLDAAHDAGTLSPDGWLNTGDVGYLTDDERLFLTGREKDLIVRSGHNIDPAAIEEVANRHPQVQISAAVGMPDQYAAEVPALFVVPRPDTTIDLADLRAFLDARVHEPPARPRHILVIDALPVTAVGKVFKPALRDMALREKLRLEVARICGDDVTATVSISRDDQQRVTVHALLAGATQAQLEALQTALQPLPQTCVLTARPRADVLLDHEGAIAILTLNSPDSLNAASQSLMQSLQARLEELASLPDLRAVILTGAGRAFCAGGDLIEFNAALKAGGSVLVDTLRYNQDVIQMLEDLPVPVIGAVNGVAIAGGLELLLCCDILLAADDARLGDGHARYGVLPGGGATVRLSERIGPARAAQLFYTAGTIDAQTALAWGLVNETVPRDQLMIRARALASEIARCSPEVLRRVKQLTGPEARSPERQARLRAELGHFAEHVKGADLREGLAAFGEKRQPRYGGQGGGTA